MSGMRGSARNGKVKVLVRVCRVDRVNRHFYSNVFVNKAELHRKGTIVVAVRIAAKYDFPVVVRSWTTSVGPYRINWN